MSNMLVLHWKRNKVRVSHRAHPIQFSPYRALPVEVDAEIDAWVQANDLGRHVRQGIWQMRDAQCKMLFMLKWAVP